MSYKEFLELVEVQVKSRMGKEVRIRIYPVMKNNSIVLDGLSILEYGDNVSPAIYLNSFYQDYLTGETMDQIINRILFCYHQGKKLKKIDTSFYTDLERARKRMVCRLVNREKNSQLLEEVPHRNFLNLAIIYYYLLEQEEIGDAAILIRKEHLKMWGIDEKILHDTAVKNMPQLLPCDFLSMEEMLHSLFPEELSVEGNGEIPLYILSNRDKSYGAVWITDMTVLEKIGNRLGVNFYVLPSSVHECMIVPAGTKMDEKMLQEMVKEINETQVAPEEVLADTVYLYDREQKTLKVMLG